MVVASLKEGWGVRKIWTVMNELEGRETGPNSLCKAVEAKSENVSSRKGE